VVDGARGVVYFVGTVVVVASIDEAPPLQRQAVAAGVCLAQELPSHVVERDERWSLEKMHRANPYHSARTESDMRAIAWSLDLCYLGLVQPSQPVIGRRPWEQKW